jgi:hypothetical protein
MGLLSKLPNHVSLLPKFGWQKGDRMLLVEERARQIRNASTLYAYYNICQCKCRRLYGKATQELPIWEMRAVAEAVPRAKAESGHPRTSV